MARLRRVGASIAAAALLTSALPSFGAWNMGVAQAAAAESANSCSAIDSALADRTLITHGHQDMGLFEAGTFPDHGLKDDESASVYESDRFAVEVSRELPVGTSLGLPFDGWYLPQTQERDLPWLGFSSSSSAGRDATITMEVNSGPGRVIVWDQKFVGDAADIVLDSENPALSVNFNTHVHYGYLFETPGVYRVTFHVAAATQAQDIVATFIVGNSCDTSSASGSNASNLSTPARLSKEIREWQQTISAFDRAVNGFDRALAGLSAPQGGTKTNAANNANATTAKRVPGNSAERAAGEEHPHNQSTAKGGALPVNVNQGKGQAPAGQPAQRAVSTQAQGAANRPAPARVAGNSGAGASRVTGADAAKAAAKDGQGAQITTKGNTMGTEPGRVPGNQGGVEAQAAASNPDIQLKSAAVRTASFWAGLLVGVGLCALLLGLALLLTVAFGKRKQRNQ